MRFFMAVLLAAATAAPARASTAASWLQGVLGVAGSRVAGFDAPAVGKAGGALPPRDLMEIAAGAEKGQGDEALNWLVERLVGLDEELDAAYAAYRESLKAGDQRKVDALKADRAYYAGIWASAVEPARGFPERDPRITPVLQGVLAYLRPLPARSERLRGELDRAARAVEKARDRAEDALARLDEEDYKMVQEQGLAGTKLEKVEARIAEAKRESAQYMTWVRQAHAAVLAWRGTNLRHRSLSEQSAAVESDFRSHAELARVLINKKLGQV